MASSSLSKKSKPSAAATSTPPQSTTDPALSIPHIDHLSTPLSQTFTAIHPLVLLSIFYYNFPQLVADPVSALLKSLLPVTALQLSYAVICLPAAGSTDTTSATSPSKSSSAKGTARRHHKSPAAVYGSRIISALLSLTLTTLLSPPVLATILVLFGSPLTTHIPHTLLLSAHLSLLTTLPLIYARGVDGGTWRAVASALLPLDEVFGGAVGALVGSWAGAVPIPLDWDREWQKWPVTIVTGAYIGYAIGKVVGGTVLKGKRIRFD